MKYLYLIISLFAFTLIHAQNAEKQPLVIGNTHTLQSVILKENPTLNVYLPHGYDTSKPYPVIYVLDGSVNEDFLHVTGLVQFFTMTFNMPESIVVGIANTDRKKDFTHPTTDAGLKKDYPTTGQSAAFIEFIEKELQPFVKSAYKTNETRYIIGQSLGGLLATEILLKKPELFTHYLIVSPSLWWDNESLLNQAEAYLRKGVYTPQYIYRFEKQIYEY
jgi:predicted alpha/beta superfamily hydrolase